MNYFKDIFLSMSVLITALIFIHVHFKFKNQQKLFAEKVSNDLKQIQISTPADISFKIGHFYINHQGIIATYAGRQKWYQHRFINVYTQEIIFYDIRTGYSFNDIWSELKHKDMK